MEPWGSPEELGPSAFILERKAGIVVIPGVSGSREKDGFLLVFAVLIF